MSAAVLAGELLETLNNMDKGKIMSRCKFLLRGEDLLMVVLDSMGGMSTPSKIAEYTDFTPARLSAIIKSLENKGFILRQQDELDKRCSIIEITEKGQQYSASLREQSVTNSMRVVESLGEKDAAEFVRLMKKLLVIMCED
ncbi:MAG: MarR family transcriptional regulator [Clostridia bacterium]|nr:MarR family transcriptional regulator [Clostridia bacterium]